MMWQLSEDKLGYGCCVTSDKFNDILVENDTFYLCSGKTDVIFVRLVEVAGYVQKEESSIRRLMALCVWIWIVLCYEF